MAQLTYDELRLLRQLERGDQTISDNQARGGLNRLVDEGYVMRRLLNPSQTVHLITAKGRAVLHEAEATTRPRAQVSKLRPLSTRKGPMRRRAFITLLGVFCAAFQQS